MHAESFAVLDFSPLKFPAASIPHSHLTNNYISPWKKHLREKHLKIFTNCLIHNIKINICTVCLSNLISLQS